MKKKTFYFTLIFTATFFYCFSSVGDSLVKFNELIFKNEAEKTAFSNFCALKEKADVIDFFLTSFDEDEAYSSKEVHQKINDCVNHLKKETESKSESKKVKMIYDYVHKSFFKVYKLQNSFADIFKKGEYNCLSASALYAIIFSKLNIPYKIVETPQHVYLITYPESLKILIETTSPEKGYYQFNSNYIEKYIKSMVSAKLISKEEYERTSLNDLFNKYYFNTGNVSLIELAGLQYSNYAVYDIDEKKFDKAFIEIQKAYFLNPSERNKYILKSGLVYILSNSNYEDEKNISKLATLCRFNNLYDEEISSEIIQNEFLRVTQSQLIKNSNYTEYEKSFNYILPEIKDTTLKKEISFDYHYELARLGYMNAKDAVYMLPHLSEAYKVSPKNANLQAIILAYFDKVVQKIDEPRTILRKMEEFNKAFDFVNDNNEYNGIRANCLLELAYQSFVISDVSVGENFIKEFEKLMTEKESTKHNPNFVERAYAMAAGIYYKKGNSAKSKQVLKNGLKYAPESFGLLQRLNQLK